MPFVCLYIHATKCQPLGQMAIFRVVVQQEPVPLHCPNLVHLLFVQCIKKKISRLCDCFLDSNDSFYPKPSTADEDKADRK